MLLTVLLRQNRIVDALYKILSRGQTRRDKLKSGTKTATLLRPYQIDLFFSGATYTKIAN